MQRRAWSFAAAVPAVTDAAMFLFVCSPGLERLMHRAHNVSKACTEECGQLIFGQIILI